MAANDAQVQHFVDEQIRPLCELIRNSIARSESARSMFSDIYDAVNAQNPTWSDNRTDGPPHLATPSDVLAWNTFVYNLIDIVVNGGTGNDAAKAAQVAAVHTQWPVIQELCVRPVLG